MARMLMALVFGKKIHPVQFWVTHIGDMPTQVQITLQHLEVAWYSHLEEPTTIVDMVPH